MVLGEWRRTVESSNVRVHELSIQLRHPSYSTSNYDNDIALWKLKSPANLNLFRVICLPVPGTLDSIYIYTCAVSVSLFVSSNFVKTARSDPIFVGAHMTLKEKNFRKFLGRNIYLVFH